MCAGDLADDGEAEPLSWTALLSFDRGFSLGERDRLDLSTSVDWTERDGEARAEHLASLGVGASWTHILRSRDEVHLSLGVREHLREVTDASFSGVTLGGGWDAGRPLLGLRLGVDAGVEWRAFDASWQAPEGRWDRRTMLRATVGLSRIDLWGFEPTVTVEASRTDSNADRQNAETLTAGLGFRSSF